MRHWWQRALVEVRIGHEGERKTAALRASCRDHRHSRDCDLASVRWYSSEGVELYSEYGRHQGRHANLKHGLRSGFRIRGIDSFFQEAINGCGELSPEERGKFFVLLGNFIGAFDNVWNQYDSGRLPGEIFIGIALNYYAIVNVPCAQQSMAQDYSLLLPWLLSSAGIDVLADHCEDTKLPSFIVE